jgi:y4mF family transcriptional regulator
MRTIMHTRPQELATEIGMRVREARHGLGLLQEELALVANVSRRTIVSIEQGKPTTRLDVLVRVLDAVGLDLQVAERR